MLRILIIDDEEASGNILKLLIEKFISEDKEIYYCNSPEKALEIIQSFQPTLVMLDIEMPNMNGFDFLNKAIGGDFDVIFTTAFDQYAIKAIRFSALDYLLKPIDKVELQNAVNKHILRAKDNIKSAQQLNNLIDNLKQQDSTKFKLALSTSEGVFFFAPAEIIRLEGENNYTRFIFNDRKPMLVSKTLKEYDDLLKPYGFLRVHKSYIVNRHFIVSIEREGYIKMKDGLLVEISRRRREEVRDILMSK
jgi:two-component system LytT family response regulator